MSERNSPCLSCVHRIPKKHWTWGAPTQPFVPACIAVLMHFVPPGSTRVVGSRTRPDRPRQHLCRRPCRAPFCSLPFHKQNHSSSFNDPFFLWDGFLSIGTILLSRACLLSDVTVELVVTFIMKWNGTRSLVSGTIKRMERGLVQRMRLNGIAE